MTLEELKKYVCDKGRLYPKNWADYLDILEISAGHPCTPLVLGGSDASDEEKPKPPKPQTEQKTPKRHYNQIYGR